jgi:methylmalonyl-CoA/ethylmalonyl-CoA epimerase
MLNKIDHVAIAVINLDAAIEDYRRRYGVAPFHREVVEDQMVEEALIPVGESLIQLVAPTREESTVARFLARQGEGLHHVGFEVADLVAVLAKLRDEGARLIDEAPRRGSRGAQIAFVHPKGGLGTLVELVQEGSATV